MKKIVKITTGVTLVLVGIVLLPVPVLSGWALIIPGLVILAEYSPTIRRVLDWAKAKFESTMGRTGGTGGAAQG